VSLQGRVSARAPRLLHPALQLHLHSAPSACLHLHSVQQHLRQPLVPHLQQHLHSVQQHPRQHLAAQVLLPRLALRQRRHSASVLRLARLQLRQLGLHLQDCRWAKGLLVVLLLATVHLRSQQQVVVQCRLRACLLLLWQRSRRLQQLQQCLVSGQN
jgi:hypothetical protein